eukprot:180710-Amorphochlora_amoeboformis.AAC.3
MEFRKIRPQESILRGKLNTTIAYILCHPITIIELSPSVLRIFGGRPTGRLFWGDRFGGIPGLPWDRLQTHVSANTSGITMEVPGFE